MKARASSRGRGPQAALPRRAPKTLSAESCASPPDSGMLSVYASDVFIPRTCDWDASDTTSPVSEPVGAGCGGHHAGWTGRNVSDT